MRNTKRMLCLVITMSFVISAVPTLATQADTGHEGWDLVASDAWMDDMIAWARKQPKQYVDNGIEVPIDGTVYFLQNGFPSSRAESRVLNACGSGYTQEGGGDHSYLLIATGDANYPNATKRQEIIDEFDDVIWPTDTTVFGTISTTKIDICVYTMDGAGGLGGYFAGGDNIWIDAADINGWGYQIMAHEFQHMIHNQQDGNEELWLNEGNSDLAIVLCYTGQASGVRSHIMAFEQSPDNDLTQFDNQGYDYGSSLAYILYLWEHYGGNATINHLVDNSANGIGSVTNTLTAKGYSDSGTEVFYMWTVANIMDDTSFDGGKWGYDEIDISVSSTSKSTYPASGGGSTRDWAADYYSFTNMGSQDLEIDFNGGTGTFRAYVAMEGRLDNPSKVERINLDGSNDGTYVVEDFGSQGTYNKVHLVIATANSGGTYDWDADIADNTPPMTTLGIMPVLPDGPDGWYVTQPTITMQTNEPGAAIYYHWDSGPDTQYSDAIKVPNGEHTIYYHAVDSSNNIEIEKGFSVKVDSSLPTTTITVDPPVPDGENGYYITQPKITLASNEDGEIFYNWDEGDWTEYTGQLTVPEGNHKIQAYSVDLRDNQGQTLFRDLKVDTSAPSTTLTLTPENATGLDGWYTAPPSVSLSTTDANTVIRYWWDLDPESEYMGDMIAGEGAHTLHYYAIDEAGNTEVERSIDIKVDTVIPKSAISIKPFEPDGMNDWYVTTPIVTLEIEEDFAASIYYRLDEEDYVLYDEEFEIEDGAHVLYWYAIDPAGNMENEHIQEMSVDTVTPVTRLVVEPNLAESEWYTETPRIEFDVSEDDATIYYHWDYDQYTQLSSTLMVPEGRHVLYYYAMDDAGNLEDELNRELRIDTQKPVAILNGPTETDVNKAVTFDGKNSKDNNEVVSYHFDFGDNMNSGWISSATTTHTYKKDGTFTVTLKVKDKAGHESAPQTKQIKVKKKATPGGGIFNPTDPDDPDSGGDVPLWEKSIVVAGSEFSCLGLIVVALIILLVILSVVLRVRRIRRRRQQAALREDEEMERGWRARNTEDPAYEDEPPLRFTEPVAFGHAHYEPEYDDDVIEAPMYEPGPMPRERARTREEVPFEPVEEETEVDLWRPTEAPVTERVTPEELGPGPAAPPPGPAPQAKPAVPAKATTGTSKQAVPQKSTATATMKAPSKDAPKPRPEDAKDPGPPKAEEVPKKKGEIDIDSEIGDILSRLQDL